MDKAVGGIKQQVAKQVLSHKSSESFANRKQPTD